MHVKNIKLDVVHARAHVYDNTFVRTETRSQVIMRMIRAYSLYQREHARASAFTIEYMDIE